MSETHSVYEALQWTLEDRLIKALRYSRKSVGQMADELGVHRNTIANYTSGRVKPDRRTLVAWAVATRVPVEFLETGRGVGGPPDGGTEAAPGGRLASLSSLTERKRSRVHGARDSTERYLLAA